MKEMIVFSNPEFGDIGVIEIDGKPYFPAGDCAKLLGYANPRDAVIRHTKGVVKHDVLTGGGVQEVNFISESNLYRLIGHSKLPIAEKFENWIYMEVVPSIRQHGMYITEKTALEALETPEEFLARALIVAQETLRKRDERLSALEAENAQLAAHNKRMEIQLDKSNEYYSIKRVAALNGIHWAAISWRKLKAESMKSHYEVQKVFASSYGNVNAYHVDVWKRVYPKFIYGDGNAPKSSPPEIKKEKRFDVYQLNADGIRTGKPLSFAYSQQSDISSAIKRLKELNPHLNFEAVLTED
jgi:prophage antirepressor-like protein